MIRFLSVIAILGALLLGAAVQAQTDEEEARLSYLLCDWGLLTVEESMADDAIFISIDSPADYSGMPGTTFTVSGTGAGLFEGNVIVEASLQDGGTVFSEPTTLQAEELGAVGDWSMSIDLGELSEATRVVVTVYSTSPEDGSIVAFDSGRLNVNSDFGLPYVEITRPHFAAGVSSSPLLIEGMAGAAFENNIVIEVRDFETKEVIAETFATIQTDELAGSGPFAAEASFDAEPGTEIEVVAFQPPVADDDEITVSDIAFAIVNPLAQTYDRFLVVQRDDPLYGAEDVCATAEAEFENDEIDPLVINDVQVLSTMSMMPLVTVSIDAAGSSNCPAPLRTRITRDGDAFTIEIYYDLSQPVACTRDLAPITQRVSLGTLPNPDFTLTVNGQPVE